MKLSELIARLAEMLEEHGDVNVVMEFLPGPETKPTSDVTYSEHYNEVIIGS
jgi:hypothetical protein